MAITISRIDSARPPGVSSSMIMQETLSSDAFLIPCFKKSDVAGLIAPDDLII
jgi:hypothetical protein